MDFLSFTSGSCGNGYFLDARNEGAGVVMIDAGVSMRRARKVLQENKLDIADVSSILITHDHLDHIRFLGTYCKYLRAKVCTTPKLHGALAVHTFTRDHIASCRQVLPANEWTDVAGFSVKWFLVPHDATQTVGYALRCGSHLFVLMTDLEHVTDEAMELASQADTVVIESNYDYDMLINGPYPPELKQRILKEGHLSNDACAQAIRKFYHPDLKNLFLCHLSGNNNTPELAYKSAAEALRELGVAQGTINLRILQREVPSPLIHL